MTSCVWRAACAPFAFHSSGYLPAVSPSVPAGMSLPARSGDHRSPRRGSRPRTDCSTVRVLPGSTWVSRIAPERIRTSPIPPGGPVQPPKKGRPVGPPRLTTCVPVVPSRWRRGMSRGQHEPIHNIEQ
jgi:hypothetical protein